MTITGDTHIDTAIDEIDAAMFSGDAFIAPEAAQKFKMMLERWGREIERNLEDANDPEGPSSE